MAVYIPERNLHLNNESERVVLVYAGTAYTVWFG